MRNDVRLRLMVACVVLPGLISIGCGDDDDDGGNGGPNPTATPGGNTPVPTATSPGDTPVPTATPEGDDTPTPGNGGGVSAEVQAFVGSAIGSIANLGMTSPAPGGGAGLIPFPITTPCTGGGSITLDCTEDGGGITFSTDFQMCLNQSPGIDSFLDGLVTVESNASCLNPFPTPGTATVSFVGDIDVDSQDGNSFAGTLDTVSEVTVLADGTTELDSSGTVTTDCIGGTATFETTEPIVAPANGPCPTAGRVVFDIDGDQHEAVYMADGSVVIDGETFASCEDLAQCS